MHNELKAFISCSFHPKDHSSVVAPLLKIISDCGIDTVHLKHDVESGYISDVIIESIRKCNLFIAIVTKRDQMELFSGRNPGDRTASGKRNWRTSSYILQEIGVACAFGKPIVVFRDADVSGNDLGLARDIVQIEFENNRSLKNQLGKDQSQLRDRIIKILQSAKRRCLEASPYINEFEVAPERSLKLNRTITVRQLSDALPWMSGSTFVDGLEFLFDQIRKEPNEIRPDVFLGINQTGVIIAAYLNARLNGKDSRPLGIIKTSAYRHDDDREKHDYSPHDKITETSSILLADSQIKRGRTGQQIIADLKREHGEKIRIYYAALIACGIDVDRKKGRHLLKPVEMSELFSKPVNKLDPLGEFQKNNKARASKPSTFHLPNFLAFVSSEGVKPPMGLP